MTVSASSPCYVLTSCGTDAGDRATLLTSIRRRVSCDANQLSRRLSWSYLYGMRQGCDRTHTTHTARGPGYRPGGNRIPGQYIVLLKPSVRDIPGTAQAIAHAHGGAIVFTYTQRCAAS